MAFFTRHVILKRFASTLPALENVKLSLRGTENRVGLVELHRPKALNSLNGAIMKDINVALKHFDEDGDIGAVVMTGSTPKAFAAGADIKELKDMNFGGLWQGDKADMLEGWNNVAASSKPLIAAVNGVAFGGGLELVLACDLAYAGEKASFGLPEVKLGVIPGGGGTQRLIRAIGKAKAMEMCLTGNPISAQQAENWGIISRVFPVESLVDEAVKIADEIANFSRIAVRICKEANNAALETGLKQGLETEKRLFFSLFGTQDSKEGLKAFVEKRKPIWKHE